MISRTFVFYALLGSLLGALACSSSDPAPAPTRDAAPEPDPQAGQPWVVDEGGGFCATIDAVAEDPQFAGRVWVTLGETMLASSPRDPATDRFRLDPKTFNTSVVQLSSIGTDVFVSLAGAEGRTPRTVVYSNASEPSELFPWAARRVARADSGCVGAERFVSTAVGTEFVVRSADGAKERTLPLPHYEHWPLFLDGMVGLADSLLILADRNAEGRGALYRVSCATLDHELIASGTSISLLHGFTRGSETRVWAIDGAFEARTLVQSDDGGKTWQRAPGLSSFVPSRIFARGDTVVVTSANMDFVNISSDGGKTWQAEAIQTFTKGLGTRTANSVLVTADGTLFVGGACNTLVHRRLPLK